MNPELQFRHHYTREQARALLPLVRRWLARAQELRAALRTSERRLDTLTADGRDSGGPTVNAYVRTLAELRELLAEFESREIQLKDLDRGLVDFPAFFAGREVFLCWEAGDDDIEYWHDLDAGFAGREKL